MAANQHCPKCKQSLAPGALEGLCPKCLALLAFNPEEEPGISAALAEAPPVRLRYFGDYELLAEIARGGMGVVFKARQVSLNRIVAVKMLLAGQFSNEKWVKRFRVEAEAAANLQHPNIVAIYEVGEQAGHHYFAMEYVDGQSLAARTEGNPLPPDLAADYLATLAQAIHYAHQRGILHRDLKPSNVLIDPLDRPRITDFGLAKRLLGDAGLTLTGELLGTPGFMAPEQVRGQRDAVTVVSDVYGLGAILYQTLTGHAPFAADSIEGVLDQVLHRDPMAPRLRNPGVPRDLETICLKCLEKEPRKRYADARALAEELGRFQRGEPIRARPLGGGEKLWRWCRRKPALAALIVALHLVGLAGLAGILWEWHRAEQHVLLETAQRVRAEEAVTALELQRAETVNAQRQTTDRLWDSYLAQARANRFSGRPGRRFDSLAVLAKAAAIRTAPELRDEAIAALALFDIRALSQSTNFGPGQLPPVFDADLERYAVNTLDGEICLRQTSDDRELLRLPATESLPKILVGFSPSGRLLAVHYEDGTVKIWSLVTRKVVFTGPCAGDWGRAGADFTPDETGIALANNRRELAVYDLTTGDLINSWPVPMPAAVARYSPDGKLLAVMTRGQRSSLVLDAASGAVVATLKDASWPYGLAWHPGGQWLAVVGSDKRIRVWDVQQGETVWVLEGHNEDLTDLAFNESGQILVSTGWDGLRFWDLRSGETRLAWSQPFSRVQFARTGRRLVRVRMNAQGFELCELADGSPVQTFGSKMPDFTPPSTLVRAAAIAPDGRCVVYAYGGNLKWFDADTGAELASARVEAVAGLAFDAQTNLWLSGVRGLFCWPFSAGKAGGPCQFGPPIAAGPAQAAVRMSVSRDGATLAAIIGGEAHVFETESRRLLATMPQRGLSWIGLSPGGGWLATGVWDPGGVKIWEVRTGRLIQHLDSERVINYPNAVAFDAQGRGLITVATLECTLWDTNTWQPRWTRSRDDLPLLAVSVTGDLIAHRDAKHQVHLLAVETGETVATLEAPTTDPPWGLAFSPDGTRLAAVGMSARELFLWDLRALRRELAALGLDWAQPPFPPERRGSPAAPWKVSILTNSAARRR